MARISVTPGPTADLMNAMLGRARSREGWGLHPRDVALFQGNMLDVLQAQTQSWLRRRRRSAAPD